MLAGLAALAAVLPPLQTMLRLREHGILHLYLSTSEQPPLRAGRIDFGLSPDPSRAQSLVRALQ